jgi:hypothetical protein
MEYWLRLLETDETNPSGDALGEQKGRGNKWVSRIE